MQSGCYINMFTGLAQCGTSFFNVDSRGDKELGDQVTVTYTEDQRAAEKTGPVS